MLRELDRRQTRDYLLLRENPHGTGSYRLKPELDLVYEWEILGDTRYLHVETNSAGMRWREVPLEKTRPRVAFVGDSFTFGESARTNERTFAAVFDAQLRAQSGADAWEVLNFGVPGFGPPDVELIVDEEVLKYEPDCLVYVFYDGNDFRDAYLGRDKYDVSRGDAVWFPELLNERIPADFRPHDYVSERVGAKPLLSELQLFRRFSRGLKQVERAFGGEVAAAAPPYSLDEFEASNEFLAYTFWSRPQYPPAAIEARDAALACFDRILAACEQRGIRMLVAALPTREQVYCRSISGVGANGVPYDIRYPQAHVEVWAAERGVPYLDLLPPLREGAARGDARVFDDLDAERGDIHMNDAGHAAVGALLAEFFARTLAE